jgi:hypothetical protein
VRATSPHARAAALVADASASSTGAGVDQLDDGLAEDAV